MNGLDYLLARANHAQQELRQVPDLVITTLTAIGEIFRAILEEDRSTPDIHISGGQTSDEFLQSRLTITRHPGSIHPTDRRLGVVSQISPIR